MPSPAFLSWPLVGLSLPRQPSNSCTAGPLWSKFPRPSRIKIYPLCRYHEPPHHLHPHNDPHSRHHPHHPRDLHHTHPPHVAQGLPLRGFPPRPPPPPCATIIPLGLYQWTQGTLIHEGPQRHEGQGLGWTVPSFGGGAPRQPGPQRHRGLLLARERPFWVFMPRPLPPYRYLVIGP